MAQSGNTLPHFSTSFPSQQEKDVRKQMSMHLTMASLYSYPSICSADFMARALLGDGEKGMTPYRGK